MTRARTLIATILLIIGLLLLAMVTVSMAEDPGRFGLGLVRRGCPSTYAYDPSVLALRCLTLMSFPAGLAAVLAGVASLSAQRRVRRWSTWFAIIATVMVLAGAAVYAQSPEYEEVTQGLC